MPTRMEILNGGEFAYYKPYIASKRDKNTLSLFLQRAKSSKAKRISVLNNEFSAMPMAFHREFNVEVVFGYPFGLSKPASTEAEVRHLLNSCESNRLPRPAICWVADISSISRMAYNEGEREKLEYLARQYFSDKPSDLRVMVDPSLCTKDALAYYIKANSSIFNGDYGAMLTLGSLMGEREVSLKDLEPYKDNGLLVKVNRNIKTDKEFEQWMNAGADYIGTPFLDRVLDGY